MVAKYEKSDKRRYETVNAELPEVLSQLDKASGAARKTIQRKFELGLARRSELSHRLPPITPESEIAELERALATAPPEKRARLKGLIAHAKRPPAQIAAKQRLEIDAAVERITQPWRTRTDRLQEAILKAEFDRLHSEQPGDWQTVSDAARVTELTKSQISKLANDGLINSVGTRKDRRIDMNDLTRHLVERDRRRAGDSFGQ